MISRAIIPDKQNRAVIKPWVFLAKCDYAVYYDDHHVLSHKQVKEIE